MANKFAPPASFFLFLQLMLFHCIMRSAQTHHCAWAIMKKFIYMREKNKNLFDIFNILHKYEQIMNKV